MKGLPRPELSAKQKAASKCHDGKCELSSTHSEGEVMAILAVGIDLAKNLFALHGVNEAGKQSCCNRGFLGPG
jgi:hypothetical protein